MSDIKINEEGKEVKTTRTGEKEDGSKFVEQVVKKDGEVTSHTVDGKPVNENIDPNRLIQFHPGNLQQIKFELQGAIIKNIIELKKAQDKTNKQLIEINYYLAKQVEVTEEDKKAILKKFEEE